MIFFNFHQVIYSLSAIGAPSCYNSRETWRYLIQISRISRFELWVANDITLVPFNSRAPVVTEFVV